ncbi:AraC family transcriptional regulator [Spirochaetia bacterium 38H-sp]|uniref:AraC family transcriptional regulator n=1 Tax=Rarispira pelagica TaxID=3141764 RepID=A0ABU9UA05_9SPIR
MYTVSDRDHFPDHEENIRITTNFLPSPYMPDHGIDLTYREHRHNFYELVFVLEGEGVHHIQKNIHKIKHGDLFIIQPMVPHYFEARGLKLVNIMFREEALEPYHDQLKRIPGFTAFFTIEPGERIEKKTEPRLNVAGTQLEEVENIIRKCIREENTRPPGYKIEKNSLLIQLLVFIARQYQHLPSTDAEIAVRIGKLIGLLETEYTRDWSLEELCNIANMSKTTLRRHFIRAVGMSPLRFLTKTRVGQACKLLVKTDNSMTEIAEKTGFKDSNYFARQFKNITGMSPREYRKRQGFTLTLTK